MHTDFTCSATAIMPQTSCGVPDSQCHCTSEVSKEEREMARERESSRGEVARGRKGGREGGKKGGSTHSCSDRESNKMETLSPSLPLCRVTPSHLLGTCGRIGGVDGAVLLVAPSV